MRQRVVVCGPPGSGKSSYVSERRKDGDFVWDFDAVRQVVFGTKSGSVGSSEKDALLAMLSAAVPLLNKWNRAWIIVTKREWAVSLANRLSAEVVLMDTPKETCIDRVMARNEPDGTKRSLVSAIAAW